MKINLIKPLSLFWFIITSFNLSAQDCGNFYNIDKDQSFEFQSFNSKNKLQGKTIMKITEVKNTSEGKEFVAGTISYDKKERPADEFSFTMLCKNGEILIDMISFVDRETLKLYQGMDIKVIGDYISIPAELKVGDRLKDGQITIEIVNPNAPNIPTFISLVIKDRMVLAKDNVTVPAGTFDTYKISYQLEMTTKMGAIKLPGYNATIIEWIGKPGSVKSEAFDKKGKVQSYTVLSKYLK